MTKKAIFVDSNDFYNDNAPTTDPDLVAKYSPSEEPFESVEPDQIVQSEVLPPQIPSPAPRNKSKREIIVKILIIVAILFIIILSVILVAKIWNPFKSNHEKILNNTTAFKS